MEKDVKKSWLLGKKTAPKCWQTNYVSSSNVLLALHQENGWRN
jgi:hypothetical protein